MQFELVKEEGLKREFHITITAAEISSKVDEELAAMSHRVKIPGFRPGKVPMDMMRKRYGSSALRDALDEAMKSGIDKLLSEKKLVPSLYPGIKPEGQYQEGKDFKYSVSFEVFPKTPDVNASSAKLTKLVVPVSDSEIDEGSKRLAEKFKGFDPITEKRQARNGDVLVIDFEGKMDGKPFAGGSSQDFRLELGSRSFIEGFEEALIGTGKDQKISFPVNFPSNYWNKEFAGKPAEFTVTVKDILEPKIPEINEDFAKRFSFASLDELRGKIKEQIEKDFAEVSYNRLKKDLLDWLDENYKFEVPQGMVELDLRAINQQLQGSEEKLDADPRALAERRVRLGILLADIGNKNNLKVTVDEIRQAVAQKARLFPGQEHKVVEFYKNDVNAVDQLKGELLEDKVINHILTLTVVTEKQATRHELECDDPSHDHSHGGTAQAKEKPAKEEKPKKEKSESEEKPKKKATKNKKEGE